MSLENEIRMAIKGSKGRLWKTQEELSQRSGVSQPQISRFLRGSGTIGMDAGCDLIESLGGSIVFPGEQKDTTREVCFVEQRPSKSIHAHSQHPVPENYMAVPLTASPVGAGEGMLDDDSVDGWVLVYRRMLPANISQDLLAVPIDERGYSMEPTLHPGDIVLVDREKIHPEEGGIYLVRDPHEMAAMVKRVNTLRKNGDIQIIFSSDNPDKKNYSPKIWSISEDYDGDMSRAIVGRVMWAWSDMSRK